MLEEGSSKGGRTRRAWNAGDVDAPEVCEFVTLRDVSGGSRAQWELPRQFGG